MRPVLRHVAMGGLLVGALVAGATGAKVVDVHASAAAVVPQLATDTTPESLSQAFRSATRRALPGVVYIEVETTAQVAQRAAPNPFEGSPFEDFFRGMPAPRAQPQPRQGSGSGFIFHEDGYILTNNHVVDGADRVTVVTQDRREFSAEVIGRDPNTDIAVVKVDATGLPVVPLGDSDAMQVGDWVVALGYPLSLGSTATAGIVSAKGRNIGILSRDEEASAPLENFIQTDAAINPGNSGGPLVDLSGRAIAVNSAIASPTGYYSGYGFAVPMALARRVAEDLIRYGEVRRPRLGVAIQELTTADAEVYGLDRPYGAEVVQVAEDSPAEEAGLEIGDVIVAVEGTPVERSGELMELLARHDPGEEVELEIVRYGERERVSVELGAFEPSVSVARDEEEAPVRGVSRLGFAATRVTPQIARQLELEEAEGIVIREVDPRGPAAQAGLRPGYRIERLNGHEISDLDDLEDAAEDLRPGSVVSLVVRDPAGTRTIINYRVRP